MKQSRKQEMKLTMNQKTRQNWHKKKVCTGTSKLYISVYEYVCTFIVHVIHIV